MNSGDMRWRIDQMLPHRRRAALHRNHMAMPWHEMVHEAEAPAHQASLEDKSSIICRAGLLMLSGGASGWRVRDCMNQIAEVLGVTCTGTVSLMSIECTCIDGEHAFSEVVSLHTTGVNTERIWQMENFVRELKVLGHELSIEQFHVLLDKVEKRPGNYRPWMVALAAAAACAAFVFLLGGGPIEMGCAFVGAGLGNLTRRLMFDRRLTHFACIGVSVAVACLAYLGCLSLLSLAIPDAMEHEAGYIGAMLFVIPGFPLITSGLDIAKLDLRSGIERAVYACSVIIVAALVAWLVASAVELHPDEFASLGLGGAAMFALRFAMSFVGVFGFSMLFNSPMKMAVAAAVVGALANTLRLTLVDISVSPEAAAFAGALAAGLMASAAGLRFGFPRISITVPSIVIMVPGLYMYRAVYCMGVFEVVDAMTWLFRAAMIVLFLPMGLALARALTDPEWRHCS